jgi:hypothetical protein
LFHRSCFAPQARVVTQVMTHGALSSARAAVSGKAAQLRLMGAGFL